MKIDYFFNILERLEALAPRSLENENKAAELIKRELEESGIDFITQEFDNYIPYDKGSYIKTDNDKIEGRGCSFEAGSFEDKNIFTSTYLDLDIDISNINYNPYSYGLSVPLFFKSPSIAVRRKDIHKILDAEAVEVSVNIEKRKHRCMNIIAGNIKNPRSILFAHYDTILKGADDDGSGVALLLSMLKDNDIDYKENAVVFSGCEELSYDYPYYWGYGYRVFEESYKKELESSEIVVVDMIGLTKPSLIDNELKIQAFPVNNKDLIDRMLLISESNEKEWIKYYHSDIDNIDLLKRDYVEEASKLVKQLIKR
ncbi:MAG: hypothetical protein ARM1_0676 [Candidatus Micrarchaeota archaeon]|nr:MAG: hypothetical protein ARM1_0676 [Candidatus Micrarchaeota archaeon]